MSFARRVLAIGFAGLWTLAASNAPTLAQSAVDDYARLRAIEVHDNHCLLMRATERRALEILVDDAYRRADEEAGYFEDEADIIADGDDEDWALAYFGHLDALQAQADALVPASCEADPSGLYQNAQIVSARLAFGLFLIASHRDGLPPSDPLYKPVHEEARIAMETYLAILQQVFGPENFAILQREATELAEGVLLDHATAQLPHERFESWQESLVSAIALERDIELAGFRARAINYYGETKLVLTDTAGKILGLGLEWPRPYLMADGNAITGWLAATPDKRVILHLLDAALLDNPPVPHILRQEERLPPELPAGLAMTSGQWRETTRLFPVRRLEVTECLIGPCFALDPEMIETLDPAGAYEVALATPDAPETIGAPDPANLRYLGIIRTALETMLPRYQ
ncbi:hypothetical protein EMQ25_17705 [Arsenicitalea aurantiaca]|uniref:Uncharacterized protein n=1 Tax=Arsenicitalea aurantiaca TaxID=1783274 RepID=A0A433X2E2_9HYPH|nr:hypothetical protein [Arsenicitalea aurantiaca]RUT28231.1 hypothetical protein EMQ25_17705 [Arsenicitalea aurantiaca]